MYKKRITIFFIGLICLSTVHVRATVFGSDSTVQAAQVFFTFPQGQSNNRLATYGLASNGFALANASTSAIFDSIFPVEGPINLNGGTLVLNRDLICRNITTLQGMGVITGQNQVLELSYNTNALPSNTSKFQDTTLVLNNDVSISSAITFMGTCTVEGNGHQIVMGANSGLKVGNNSSLVLRNVTINGVSGTNVQCLNDGGLLVLDNATWIQKTNSSFVLGTLQFKNDVLFTGTTTFAYQSLKTSLINAQSSLILDDGFTFSYDPTRLASKTLLQFVDATSSLILHGATLATTVTGLNLTRGSLEVYGDSVFAPQTRAIGLNIIDNGITLGDGLSSANDCATTIHAGARLQVAIGSLNYRNVLSSSWFMENSISQLNMGDSTTLRLYQSMNINAGSALLNDNVTLARTPAAQLLGSTAAVGSLFFVQL